MLGLMGTQMSTWQAPFVCLRILSFYTSFLRTVSSAKGHRWVLPICSFPYHDLEIMPFALISVIIVLTSSYFICLTLPNFFLLKLFPVGRKKKYNLYYFFLPKIRIHFHVL